MEENGGLCNVMNGEMIAETVYDVAVLGGWVKSPEREVS